MDTLRYSELKTKEAVTLSIDKDKVRAISKKYDSNTGGVLPSEEQIINRSDLVRQRSEKQSEIEKLQGHLSSLDELIADFDKVAKDIENYSDPAPP